MNKFDEALKQINVLATSLPPSNETMNLVRTIREALELASKGTVTVPFIKRLGEEVEVMRLLVDQKDALFQASHEAARWVHENAGMVIEKPEDAQ